MKFLIYRYNPETDQAPWMQALELAEVRPGMMLRDALLELKAQRDETLTFRHSCGEGVCGSDGLNVNGRNVLACITPLKGLREPVTVRPLPRLPVIRDLVADMRAIPILRRFGCPVFFDATHSVQLPGGGGDKSAGQREFAPVLARCALAAGADGLFIETHPEPDHALSDGPNMLPLSEMPALLKSFLKIFRAAA